MDDAMTKYSTHEVCKRIGVSKSTLFQWLQMGKVKDVARDQRGWRVFNEEDIERLKEFKLAHRVAIHPKFKGLERRHFTRTEINFSLEYTPRNSSKKKGKSCFSTMTQDIGGGGFLIQCYEALPVDQLLDVNLSCPAPVGIISTVGEVRWLTKVPYNNQHYLTGCRFVSIKARQRRQLMDFLFSQSGG